MIKDGNSHEAPSAFEGAGAVGIFCGTELCTKHCILWKSRGCKWKHWGLFSPHCLGNYMKWNFHHLQREQSPPVLLVPSTGSHLHKIPLCVQHLQGRQGLAWLSQWCGWKYMRERKGQGGDFSKFWINVTGLTLTDNHVLTQLPYHCPFSIGWGEKKQWKAYGSK